MMHRGGGSTLALVRQNIVEVLYLYAGLENGLVCSGIDYGMDYGVYSNTQLYCLFAY